MFQLLERQRIRLLDQLEGVSEEQWNTPSLCSGWRVRDVLGHLVSLQDVPTWKFMVGGFGMSGFDRQVNRFALEYGTREPARLLADYRRHAGGRVGPPIVGPIAPLTDITVHALDIQRPLELPGTTEPEVTRMVLDRISSGLFGFVPKKLVKGLHFVAPDIGWSAGEGPNVEALSSDIVLALNGRCVPHDHFRGDGAADFETRRR